MNITVTEHANATIVTFAGALDTKTAPLAEQRIDALLAGGATNLVIDFEPLSFISSAGLGVVLATAKRLRATGGNLHLYGLNEAVRQVFDLSGFSMILPVFEQRDDALRGL